MSTSYDSVLRTARQLRDCNRLYLKALAMGEEIGLHKDAQQEAMSNLFDALNTIDTFDRSTCKDKDDAGPYIAWYQTAFGRVLVEVTSTPKWSVPVPYYKYWRRPIWRVEVRDPLPSMVACSGQPEIEVRHLHPMNAATRELLSVRESFPPSPFEQPL